MNAVKTTVSSWNSASTLHDLSYPRGDSTNDATDRSGLPQVTYSHVASVAKRIKECANRHKGRRVGILTGDVKGAFRHLMLYFHSVRWMGARLPEHFALVIDLPASFGWTSSLRYDDAFGGIITWLLTRESPASLSGTKTDDKPFFGYE